MPSSKFMSRSPFVTILKQRPLEHHMRYFFDVDGNGVATKDSGGVECPDAAIMRRTAFRILAEIASDTAPSNDQVHLTMQVRNLAGLTVFEAIVQMTGKAAT